MRIVIDTNILVSGLFWKGSSQRVLNLWVDGRVIIVSSNEILAEASATLSNFKVRMPDEQLTATLSFLRYNCLIVEPFQKLHIVKYDEEDNRFLEAAIAGRADFIVTKDKHLLRVKEFCGVRIVTPGCFLALLTVD